ncbi:MAG: radical SAM protein, partial [Candidatus Wallbacteria bacterium]|nr:radical SAM protein [Candidatus Wallbacteria bacterium]
MNIILINPPSPLTGEHLHGKGSYPHLGLGSLSASMSASGHHCRTIDAKFSPMTIRDIIKRCVDFNPDLICITSRTFDFPSAVLTASAIRSVLRVPLVLGGSHASTMPYQILGDYNFIDFVVRGEGEIPLVRLCSGDPPSMIHGLYFRDCGRCRRGPMPELPDPEALPSPVYHEYIGSRCSRVFIMAARGCPYNCLFCGSVLGKKMRRRQPESIAAEIQSHLAVLDFDLLEFADESFTLDSDYACSVMAILRKCFPGLRWAASTRADLLNREIIREMKASGCVQLAIGAESGDPAMLRRWQKNILPSQVLKSVRICETAGIRVDLNFILGGPFENYRTLFRTLRFLLRANPSMASVSIGVPYPG